MEEAAFMKSEVFATIVVPLLGMEKTAVLAISTPDDEYNYYTKLMDTEVNGAPLFKTIRIGLACDSCTSSGIACTHKVFKLPSWKPVARQEKIDAIMKTMPEINARENAGQTLTSQKVCEKKWIKALQDRKLWTFQNPVSVIHIGIDPSGGGSASDYALNSMAYDNAQYVILGAETIAGYKYNNIMTALDNHLLALRAISKYKHAIFWIYVEANMSFIAVDELRDRFLGNPAFGQVYIARFDPKNKDRYGVWTGEKEKAMYAKLLAQNLSDGRIHYAENFVCVSKETTAEMKAILEEQIGNLRKDSKPVLQPGHDKVKYTYTGKSAGVQDDASMALQITLYNMIRQRDNYEFIASCERHGLPN